MATLLELKTLFENAELLARTESAIIIAANSTLASTPAAKEKSWAVHAFSSPQSEAKKALMALLAANSGQDVATIKGATDAAIQNRVNNIVSFLIDSRAGM